MSRQQFLAELTQYLTFVTPDEQGEIIRFFEEKFDSVGVEGEATLLMELGTPMSIAIALKRRKEAGDLGFSTRSPQEQPGSDPAAYDTEPSPESGLFGATHPDENGDIPYSEEQLPAEQFPVELFSKAVPMPDEADDNESENELFKIISDSVSQRIELEDSAPIKKLSAGAKFGAFLLSFIVTAIFAVPTAAGGCLVVVMANFVFGALRTLSTTADALWMFALGFGTGAIGLIIFWLFLWAIISSIRRLFCGKAPEKSGFRRGIRKAWKSFGIISIILLVLGIGCGVAGFSMGGNPVDLFDNQTAATLLDWLSDNFVTNLVLSLFG